MKILIPLALLAILGALGSAGLAMLRPSSDPARRGRMAKALSWRIGLSIALFLLVLLAWALGWVEPKGLPVGR